MNLDDLKKSLAKDLKDDTLFFIKQTTDGVSSGLLELNKQLTGSPLIGFPFGRIVEIFGPESSGKSTMALTTIIEAQKSGIVCGYIDAEYAVSIKYAKQIGVDIDSLLLTQPETAEDSLLLTQKMIENGVRLVVWDSLEAFTPQQELDGDFGDANMGVKARLVGQALRKLKYLLREKNALLIVTNQLRTKMGVMYGNPEDTPGGKALKFYSTIRLSLTAPRGGAVKEKMIGEKDNETGIEQKIKIIKNKIYIPQKNHEAVICYGTGYDKLDDRIAFLIAQGLFGDTNRIVIDGKSYTKKTLKAACLENEDIFNTVTELVNTELSKW